MSSEQRLSVTFGTFSCDVVGYEDPFSVLTRVVDLLSAVAAENPAFGAGAVRLSDLERAQVAAGLADASGRLDEVVDEADERPHYVVTRDDEVAAEDVSAEPAPAEAPVVEDELAAFLDGGEPIIAKEPLTEAPVDEVVPEVDETETPEDEVTLAVASEGAPDDALSAALAAAVEVARNAERAAEPPVESDETIVVADEPIAERPPLRLGVPAEEPTEAPAEPVVEEPVAVTAPTEETEAQVTAKAEAAAEDAPAKPRKPRVTVTKLPLRPERKPKQELTPVQQVEPVVTLSPSIADSALEAEKAVRRRPLKRDDDDEMDNFLFADVDEAVRENQVDAEARREPDVFTLDNAASEPEQAEAQPVVAEEVEIVEPKKKRGLVGLLSLGRALGRRDAEEETTLRREPAAPEAELEPAPASDPFERLRDTVAAASGADMNDDSPALSRDVEEEPVTVAPTPLRAAETVAEAIDYDDESSPAAFARQVGANSLQDLLEASAVYMSLVEGKAKFSRRDVMQALNQIESDKDYSQEARLKSFRKLLTSGSLVRVDDGMFAVSQATRFGYETQLQA